MRKLTFKIFIGMVVFWIVFNDYIPLWVNETNSMESLYLMTFGFIPLSNRNFLFEICLSIVNIIYIIFVFSENLQFEIKVIGTYIFTRTNKRKEWILKQYLKTFLKLSVYLIIQYSMVFIIGSNYGYEINNINNFIAVGIMSLGITLLSIFSIIVLINTLAIFFDYIFAYMVSVSAITINMIIVSTLINSNYAFIIKYLPFSQHLIGIKDIEFIDRSIHMFNSYIPDFNIGLSLIIICVIILFGISLSVYRITKMDIF
ncbi:MAG: DUF2705 family protein [Clostridium sp.]